MPIVEMHSSASTQSIQTKKKNLKIQSVFLIFQVAIGDPQIKKIFEAFEQIQ